MEFIYNTEESENYPATMGVERWFRSEVDPETGIFEVPEDHPQQEAIESRLKELGHEPVDSPTESEEDNTDDPQEDPDPLAGVSEDDLVELNGNEIKSLASDFDDLDGRKSADELLEKLILKLRE